MDYRFRPDLAPDWRDLGNAPEVDEYLRRQAMSVGDYAQFCRRPASATSRASRS